MRSKAGVKEDKNSLPDGVKITWDLLRLNKSRPNHSSKMATCLLIAPWVTCNSWAALVKLTCLAAASNALTAFKGGSFLIFT